MQFTAFKSSVLLKALVECQSGSVIRLCTSCMQFSLSLALISTFSTFRLRTENKELWKFFFFFFNLIKISSSELRMGRGFCCSTVTETTCDTFSLACVKRSKSEAQEAVLWMIFSHRWCSMAFNSLGLAVTKALAIFTLCMLTFP